MNRAETTQRDYAVKIIAIMLLVQASVWITTPARLQAQGRAPGQTLPANPPLKLSEHALPVAFVNFPYRSSISFAGGGAPYRVSIGGELPPGVMIETGGEAVALSGAPAAWGRYSLNLVVTDATGLSTQRDYTLYVQPPLFQPQVQSQTVSISDTEMFHLADSDRTSIFFPVSITDAETFHLADHDTEVISNPVVLTDNETFHLTDAPGIEVGSSGPPGSPFIFVASSTGSVSSFFNDGTVQTASISGGGVGLAVDSDGDVWSINPDGAGVTKFSDAGSVDATYAPAGLTNASAIAIDGNSTVWLVQGGSSNNIYAITSNGVPVSTTGFAAAGSISNPASISVDAAGSLWIANTGNNTVTEIIGIAAPIATPTVTQVITAKPAVKP